MHFRDSFGQNLLKFKIWSSILINVLVVCRLIPLQSLADDQTRFTPAPQVEHIFGGVAMTLVLLVIRNILMSLFLGPKSHF